MNMNLGLTKKLALVTASSGGIGLAIARSLAAEGAKVAVNGRTEQSVEKAIANIRRDVPAADLTPLVADNASVKGCATTIAELSSVDILVNNLGVYEAVGFFDESDADWLRMFETNIMSGVRLSRHYLRGMLDRGEGRIVFNRQSVRRPRWRITAPPKPCN
jgi:3-oxoacyl-[acyl-carrier protein] reductase